LEKKTLEGAGKPIEKKLGDNLCEPINSWRERTTSDRGVKRGEPGGEGVVRASGLREKNGAIS